MWSAVRVWKLGGSRPVTVRHRFWHVRDRAIPKESQRDGSQWSTGAQDSGDFGFFSPSSSLLARSKRLERPPKSVFSKHSESVQKSMCLDVSQNRETHLAIFGRMAFELGQKLAEWLLSWAKRLSHVLGDTGGIKCLSPKDLGEPQKAPQTNIKHDMHIMYTLNWQKSPRLDCKTSS